MAQSARKLSNEIIAGGWSITFKAKPGTLLSQMEEVCQAIIDTWAMTRKSASPGDVEVFWRQLLSVGPEAYLFYGRSSLVEMETLEAIQGLAAGAVVVSKKSMAEIYIGLVSLVVNKREGVPAGVTIM